MSTFFLRAGLWLSLVVAVVAVFIRFQQPLQEIFQPEPPSQTFCYSEGITAKFSTNARASCFTVKDGVFVDVFTPESDPPVELHQGHSIPGLWDGVSHKFLIHCVVSHTLAKFGHSMDTWLHTESSSTQWTCSAPRRLEASTTDWQITWTSMMGWEDFMTGSGELDGIRCRWEKCLLRYDRTLTCRAFSCCASLFLTNQSSDKSFNRQCWKAMSASRVST